ncbi:MAG: hypothetical protein PUE01_13025 [Clostridiaceae bacterium]|nr:hypothetical protein [Clostridiaceae bacterium]
MSISEIFALIILVVFIVFTAYRNKNMLIRANGGLVNYISIPLFVVAVAVYSYIYASSWYQYVIAVLAVVLWVLLCYTTGITSKGFVTNYKNASLIRWKDVREVEVCQGKVVTLKVIGDGTEVKLKFNSDKYKEIVDLVIKNTSFNAKINYKKEV